MDMGRKLFGSLISLVLGRGINVKNLINKKHTQALGPVEREHKSVSKLLRRSTTMALVSVESVWSQFQ